MHRIRDSCEPLIKRQMCGTVDGKKAQPQIMAHTLPQQKTPFKGVIMNQQQQITPAVPCSHGAYFNIPFISGPGQQGSHFPMAFAPPMNVRPVMPTQVPNLSPRPLPMQLVHQSIPPPVGVPTPQSMVSQMLHNIPFPNLSVPPPPFPRDAVHKSPMSSQGQMIYPPDMGLPRPQIPNYLPSRPFFERQMVPNVWRFSPAPLGGFQRPQQPQQKPYSPPTKENQFAKRP